MHGQNHIKLVIPVCSCTSLLLGTKKLGVV